MRQINQTEGGGVLFLHPLRGGGDPFGRGDARRRPPKGREGKLAEIALQLLAQAHRLGVHIEDLAAVRRIERPRRDREIRAGMHVIPPEQLGAGEARDLAAQLVPEFFSAHDVVALFPEAHLGGLSVIPAVADDAMLRRRPAGKDRRLRRAGHGGKSRLVGLPAVFFRKGRELRRVRTRQGLRKSDDVENGESHADCFSRRRGHHASPQPCDPVPDM